MGFVLPLSHDLVLVVGLWLPRNWVFSCNRVLGLQQELVCENIVEFEQSSVGEDLLELLLLQILRITQFDIALICRYEDVDIVPLGDDHFFNSFVIDDFLIRIQLEDSRQESSLGIDDSHEILGGSEEHPAPGPEIDMHQFPNRVILGDIFPFNDFYRERLVEEEDEQ